MTASLIPMSELIEAAEALNRALSWAARDVELSFVERNGDLVTDWAGSRKARIEHQDRQQEAEIRAELAIPQHLIW